MSAYAVGKKAFGFCDRCGFRYPLDELRKETVNAFKIDLRVCEECWDPDHPQNKLGKENPSDPRHCSIRDPTQVLPQVGTGTAFSGTLIQTGNTGWDFPVPLRGQMGK